MITATVILVTIFYLLTLFVSSYGDRFIIRKSGKLTLPLGVGIFTMAATWIGGGFINGTAESSYSYGIVATQAPIAYALSMIVGGVLFCHAIYTRGYTTFIDPIKESYGSKEESFVSLIAIFSEVMWTAAILVALGQSFAVVFEIPSSILIIVSAIVAVLYTARGGMGAVALTDVLQLFLLVIGLLVCYPYFMGSMNFTDLTQLEAPLFNRELSNLFKATANSISWWDSFLLLVFGGIPWGVYFQRVLAMESADAAKKLSIVAGFICFFVALIPLTAGLFLKHSSLSVSNPSLILPYAMKHLCPPVIAALGISAISCAVMSSIDSTILSSSQLFSNHILTKDSKFKPPQYMVCVGVGFLSVLLALKVQSVYSLWYLCSEFVYIFIFPHFVTSLFCTHFNKKVFWTANIVALLIRLILPIDLFSWQGFQASIELPVKSLAMLASLIILLMYNLIMEVKTQQRGSHV